MFLAALKILCVGMTSSTTLIPDEMQVPVLNKLRVSPGGIIADNLSHLTVAFKVAAARGYNFSPRRKVCCKVLDYSFSLAENQ